MDAVNKETGTVNYIEERNVSENGSLPKFQKNDILFARITPSTENGKVCIIEKFDYGIASSELIVLRPTNKVLPKYLFYFVKSDRIRKFAISQMMGTTGRQRVPDNVFKKYLRFELPTLEEQQQIASVLSKVDELIEKTDQIIKETQRLKKGLMQRLLTKGIGHTKFKKTKLGEIPEEWEIMKLYQICKQITDGVHKTPQYLNEGIPFISVNNLSEGKINFKNCKFISPKEHKELIKRCNPIKGDILLSKVGTLGIADIITTDFEFSIFVQLALLKPEPSKIYSLYLKYVLNSKELQNQINNNASGSTLRYIGINKIDNLSIPYPSLKEQQQIASILSKVDELIQKQQNNKSNLENLKKGLMQKLLTGKIRVKV